MLPRYIGMIHLPPLPGSPRAERSLNEIEAFVLADVEALVEGGVDGIMIENFGDTPFTAGRVAPHTVASMTRIVLSIRKQVTCPIGVNVLRNDAASALGIAKATDAQFIRVNIHTGVMATDQGIITGEADETLRLRAQLGATSIAIMADVLVKHASPLGEITIEDAVEDTLHRGLADAVIVSGSATGKPANREQVERACRAAGESPVYLGSGVTLDNLAEFVPPAYGVIVGTALKQDGKVDAPVDRERVRRLADQFSR